MAYLGRYAHQPAPVSLAMPVRRLRRLLAATRELVEEEMRAHVPGGGD